METSREFESILAYFKEISAIPRCSGDEKAVSDYLLGFAQSRGIEVRQDEHLNILMKRPASPGREASPTVLLQGHMDMVCVKTEDSDHDFETEGLDLYEEDGFLKARNTTLGADNGIAVAYIMALMASRDLSLPALEGLVTTAEETGMDGAVGLDASDIRARVLVNLDSEEEGVFLASCAGGVNNRIRLPLRWEAPAGMDKAFKLRIGGLTGGHSGADIDKNRANAIKLAGRLLEALDPKRFRLFDAKGGNKRNAIPDYCALWVACSEAESEALAETVRAWEAVFRKESGQVEPDLVIRLEASEPARRILEPRSLRALTDLLRLMPAGIQTMSPGIPGLVESSVNPGVLAFEKDSAVLSSSVRSSVRSLKDEINGRIACLCRLVGADMSLDSDYPEWTYNPHSPVRELMMKTYEEMYGKPASVEAIHAGLECGLLGEKMPGIDMISLGPDMFDVHSTRERLDLASVDRTWQLLKKTLERI